MRFYDATVKLCSHDDRREYYVLHRFGYYVHDPLIRMCGLGVCVSEWKTAVRRIFERELKRLNRTDADWSVRRAHRKNFDLAKCQSPINNSSLGRDRAAIRTATKMIFKNNFSTSVEVSFISVQCKQSMDMVRFCVTQTISRSVSVCLELSCVCMSVSVHGRIVLMLTDNELLIGYSFSVFSSLISTIFPVLISILWINIFQLFVCCFVLIKCFKTMQR